MSVIPATREAESGELLAPGRWRHVPVIPATQEAEAGEPLEAGRQRLQWAEIMPLYSSMGNKSKILS